MGLVQPAGSPYDHLIAYSPFGIALIDEVGVYREVNPSYCETYGYARDAMLGRSFTMVFPEDSRALILQRHHAFLAGQGPLSGEWSVVRSDGSQAVVITESVRVELPDGTPARLVYLVDITARIRAEAALRRREATFRALFETLPIGVVYHDVDGSIRKANPSALRILGMDLDQLRGLRADDPDWCAVREDGSPFPLDQHPAPVALRTGKPVEDVVMGLRRRGHPEVWLRVSAVPVFRDGQLQEVYASFQDISLSVCMARELHAQASTDYLTGALNRRSFMERLVAEYDRVQRHPQLCSSVLIADLDHFKQINDTHGHAAGDVVLRHVTLVMQSVMRRTDVLGRHGGEEFAVLLPETDTTEAHRFADRLREAVAASPVCHIEQVLPVTVSIGISPIVAGDSAVDLALQRADAALYRAKRSGRNRVELCEAQPVAARPDCV